MSEIGLQVKSEIMTHFGSESICLQQLSVNTKHTKRIRIYAQ